MEYIENYVARGLELLALGREYEAIEPFSKIVTEFRRCPSVLQRIENDSTFSSALVAFLSYGTIDDIDRKQQIASIAYFFASKAIRSKNTKNEALPIHSHFGNDVGNRVNRLIIMIEDRESFNFTVSSVVSKEISMFNPWFMIEQRSALDKMILADLKAVPLNVLGKTFPGLVNELVRVRHRLGIDDGANENAIIAEGEKLHNRVYEYLYDKIIANGDVEF